MALHPGADDEGVGIREECNEDRDAPGCVVSKESGVLGEEGKEMIPVVCSKKERGTAFTLEPYKGRK